MEYFKITGKMTGIRYPAIVDIKYDGMPVKVSYKAGMPLLLTTEAGKTYSLPHLTVLSGVGTVELMAEWIYGTGKNGSIWPLLSAIHKDLTSTSLRVFDLLELNHTSLNRENLSTRRMVLKSIIKPEFLPRSWTVNNALDLMKISKAMHEEGYEGLVIKNTHETFPLQSWVKLKIPFINQLYVSKVDAARIEVNYNGVQVGLNLPGFPVKAGDLIEVKHYGVTANGSLRNAVAVKKILVKGGVL